MNSDDTQVRLDKWLWAARFFKTRKLAHAAIDGGKVHYNGSRTKPSRNVQIGDMLLITQGYDNKEVKILALAEKRGSAKIARHLYDETEQSQQLREKNTEQRKLNRQTKPKTKPSKKARRELIKVKQGKL